jgi:cytosine deaminase
MALGADVVGGLPWYELTDEDARRHIDIVFAIARERDADVHMLVDDTDDANSRSLEYLAVKTLREGWGGRVAASHCGALAAYNATYAAKVVALVKGRASPSSATRTSAWFSRAGAIPSPCAGASRACASYSRPASTWPPARTTSTIRTTPLADRASWKSRSSWRIPPT